MASETWSNGSAPRRSHVANGRRARRICMERAKRGTWGKHHWFPYGHSRRPFLRNHRDSQPSPHRKKRFNGHAPFTNGRVSGPCSPDSRPGNPRYCGNRGNVRCCVHQTNMSNNWVHLYSTTNLCNWALDHAPRSRALTILPEGSS